MTDVRAWPKQWWSDYAVRNLATLGRAPRPSGWPLVGMFGLGLAAGALGCYAVVQRSQIKRLADRTFKLGEDALPRAPEVTGVSVTSHRSNHRRKAVEEVSKK